MIIQYIKVCQVPLEWLENSGLALGFYHLPQDLANVNHWHEKICLNPILNHKKMWDKSQGETALISLPAR